MHTHTHKHTHTRTYTHTHEHTHTHIYKYVYTHTHAHIHTQIDKKNSCSCLFKLDREITKQHSLVHYTCKQLTYKQSSVATNFRPGTFEESNAAHDIEIHLVGEVLDLVGENSFKEPTQYMTDSMQELKELAFKKI